jgi:hypothetical protein
VDVLDVAILGLRIALAAVLYLFLWLVVRAAWRNMQAAPPAAESRPAAAPAATPWVRASLQLLVLEAGGSDLPPGQVIELADGATLGRTARASVVVADPAISAEHAQVHRVDGTWVIADLGSTNGTLVNQALVHGEAALEPGDVVALGNVRLKVVGR